MTLLTLSHPVSHKGTSSAGLGTLRKGLLRVIVSSCMFVVRKLRSLGNKVLV